MLSIYTLYNQPLTSLGIGKTLINTLNAHCYNVAQTDAHYQEALLNSDVLIPDGISIIWAARWLSLGVKETRQSLKLQKIAGADLFFFEMERLQNSVQTRQHLSLKTPKCFFLGSSESTLAKIKERAAREYPGVNVQTYSPPYKSVFTIEDNKAMLDVINAFQPDVLMVGMTAPKQEKWAYQHFEQLEVGHVCCIGAVFDFYAGSVNRAPKWVIKIGFEWLYRLIKEPRRMWRRYLIGNTKFIYYVIKEKFALYKAK